MSRFRRSVAAVGVLGICVLFMMTYFAKEINFHHGNQWSLSKLLQLAIESNATEEYQKLLSMSSNFDSVSCRGCDALNNTVRINSPITNYGYRIVNSVNAQNLQTTSTDGEQPPCSLPSDIEVTMRQSSRSGFDRQIQNAPPIDDNCIQNYLKQHLDYCERAMKPQRSNLVQYWERDSVIERGSSSAKCLCPCVPDNLDGRVNTVLNETWYYSVSGMFKAAYEGLYQWPGGRFTPSHCFPRYRVAFILPYSEREKHLKIFLNFMIPYLKRQLLDFQIFVVEQIDPELFSRASLFNVGYLEVRKRGDFDCVFFHDLDLFPLDDRYFYSCRSAPEHRTAHLDKHKFVSVKRRCNRVWWILHAALGFVPTGTHIVDVDLDVISVLSPLYHTWFGGVEAFTPAQFELINGFGTKYYGWGGEDDDLFHRLVDKRLNRNRPPNCVSLYRNLKHKRDARNPDGKHHGDGFKMLGKEYDTKGLRQTHYTLLDTVDENLFLKLRVVLPPPPVPPSAVPKS